MHAWEAIQKSLDYIEDNLPEDIKMETLAGVAALSPYYYQRLFGRLVKRPVYEYIKLRRLAKASEALKNKKMRITDAAMGSGFSDHAGFTRAFKTAYGITPEEYRDHPVILNQFIKPDLKLKYVTVDEGVPLIADGIVVEVNRRRLDKPRLFIGIKGEVPAKELGGGTTTGIAIAGGIWEDFHRRKPDIPHLLPGGNELGALYKGDAGAGRCTYMAGAEAVQDAAAEGYASFRLPGGEYAVCRFEAENFSELIGSAVFKAVSFMNSWIRKHDLTCGDFAAELYFDAGPDGSCMELWLPLIPAREKSGFTEMWDKTDAAKKPSLETVNAYVSSPLWEQLREYMEEQYAAKPVLEYSGCSMQRGWNIKYKKAGRTLCTLYPMEGYYIALIVIGDRERAETESALPFFTEYLQELYRETKTGMGQKWLMVNVTDNTVLEDVKKCIAIRRGIKKR